MAEQSPYSQFKILNHIPDVAVALSLDGIILFANHHFETIVAIPAMEFVHGNVFDLHTPDELPLSFWVHFFRSHLSEPHIQHQEIKLPTAQGMRWFAVEACNQFISDTKTPICLIIARDITKEKKSELEIERRWLEFHALVEHTPDIILRVNKGGDIVYVNRTITKIFGNTVNYYIGMNIRELHLFDQQHCTWYHHLKLVFDTGIEQKMELAVLTPDGQRWFYSHTVPIVDSNDGIESVLVVVRDITDSKKFESSIQKQYGEFQALVEHTPDGIVRINNKGVVLYINPAVEKLFKVHAFDVIGKSIPELNIVWDDFSHWSFIIDQVFQTGDENKGVVLIKSKKRNTVRWFETLAVPEFDSNGTVVSVISVNRDITDLKQAETELLILLAQEKQLSDLRTRISHIISHEIRTPLSSIQFSAEIIEQFFSTLNEHQVREHIADIKESILDMKNILDNLLSTGKPESLTFEISPVHINVIEHIQRLITDIQKLTLSSHQITCITEEEQIDAEIDEKLLSFIVKNLLFNAIKYSEPSQPIFCTISTHDERVLIGVQDTGIGIPNSELHLIFNPFYRASNASSIVGSGLGLYIVKNCVEIHRGSITVQSEPNVGTTFTVALPLQYYVHQRSFNEQD